MGVPTTYHTDGGRLTKLAGPPGHSVASWQTAPVGQARDSRIKTVAVPAAATAAIPAQNHHRFQSGRSDGSAGAAGAGGSEGGGVTSGGFDGAGAARASAGEGGLAVSASATGTAAFT